MARIARQGDVFNHFPAHAGDRGYGIGAFPFRRADIRTCGRTAEVAQTFAKRTVLHGYHCVADALA